MYLLFHDVFASDPRDSGFASPAADRYKLSVAEFDRELMALSAMASRGRPFELTFDDGGESFFTIAADRLEARGWRGVCFVATDYIGRPGFLSRAMIHQLHQRGHRIGSHSASHPACIRGCSREVIHREWRTSVEILSDIAGERITAGSVPGGFYSKAVAEEAAAAGIETLFTSEPVQATHRVAGCQVAGRFTIRRGCTPGLAGRLVADRPWSRWGMWAQWNAKAALKPVLGSSYSKVADWLMVQNAPEL